MSETPEAFRQYERKARIPHQCCECGGTIQPQEQYLYISGIWEGEPESYKRCLDCVELIKSINKDKFIDESVYLSGLWDWISESRSNELREKFNVISDKRRSNLKFKKICNI